MGNSAAAAAYVKRNSSVSLLCLYNIMRSDYSDMSRMIDSTKAQVFETRWRRVCLRFVYYVDDDAESNKGNNMRSYEIAYARHVPTSHPY